MNKNQFIRFLSAFELSHSKITKILEEMEGEFSFEKFYLSDKIEEILGKDYTSIAKKSNEEYFKMYEDRLKEKGIGIVTCEDEDYPEKFVKIDDAPYYFFYIGDLSLLKLPAVSMVGTRSPSGYGAVITERFAGDIASAGGVIISGLAYGVDGLAHRKALAVGGKTIAVLAGGFDKVYPAEHNGLFREICEKGLVISELRPDIKALKFHFPQRNRIVAALADALLITEAGAKSGTSITKDFALDYGVPIYAVPGNITSEKSEGTNYLIASMQGICVLEPKFIIDELGLKQKKVQSVQLSMNESLITDALKGGQLSMDEIAQISKLNIAKLSSLLTSLEIKAIIRKVPGGFYTLA